MTHIEEGSNQYACLSVPCQIIDHGHRGSWWYLSRLEIELITTSRASSTTCSSTSLPVSISPLASSSPSFTWCSYRCYETCYSCCCQPRPALVLVCTALLWGWQLPTGVLFASSCDHWKVKGQISNYAKNVKFQKEKVTHCTTVSPAQQTQEEKERWRPHWSFPTWCGPLLVQCPSWMKRVSLLDVWAWVETSWDIWSSKLLANLTVSFNSSACESDVLMHTRVKLPQCIA